MKRFDTPLEVATLLARHAPKKISTILEPAVGEGVLLEAIGRRFKNSFKDVVSVDIDLDVLETVPERLFPLFGNALKVVHDDFFKWTFSNGKGAKSVANFDCVIMNPPFSGRNKDLVRLDLPEEVSETYGKFRFVPLEVAFVVRAISLIRSKGRLLAVVPASIISSRKTNWLRHYIMQVGAVEYVYELNKFTFKGVEARVYLLVFTKNASQKDLKLRKQNFSRSDELLIDKADLQSHNRFDYVFHDSHRWYNEIIQSSPHLGWIKLDDVAKIYRGKIVSPIEPLKALHTSDHRMGFWHSNGRTLRKAEDISGVGLQNGDILVKRVGRKCAQSFGKTVGHEGAECSDCLLIVRPNQKNKSIKLLLALRVLYGADLGAHLIEKGTGATYLTERDLRSFRVPLKISDANPNMYRRYRNAVAKRRADLMVGIEEEMRKIWH